MSNLPAWIGIPGSVLFIAVIVYGLRQGMKVGRAPEGTASENLYTGGDFGDGGSGPHS